MKLYGNPMSTCTRKVLTVLAEKGHQAEFINIDLMKHEQKTPEHIARQPFGVVPALELDDGFIMYESRAIARFLDRTLPGPSLTPVDPKAYALMEQFIGVEQSYFSGQAMKIVMERFRGTNNEENVAKGREGMKRPLEVLDAALANRPFLAGNDFTLAEVCFAPYMEYLFAMGEKDTIAPYKNVMAWWDRVSNRPSVKKAHGR
ncbi:MULTISPECIES: glutathione S-transferase family protein [unclassified Corallococcus]|uniref:glutathione S-transferase family protein n=1 Tax=unclassified Corallococcus TaxID=2685029 RepID=UPI001A8D1650|nr:MULTISPECIES: glutathione S-transferase family protein [unclassified Corallococcus]MBN9687875.1 glutathione S-transferase family protein [Corallococcus sp. NCSPR001]WAS88312.1 glutathione S-transferase family protein [Corallococcus sp. NCRR]